MRSYGLIPAAGRSRRMGRPKLLLPWGEGTVIQAVIEAWLSGGVNAAIVVVHPEDRALAQTAEEAGATVVVASQPPPDMKASVLLGLEYVAGSLAPSAEDAWLLAPADMPRLPLEVIAGLLASHNPADPAILVPVQGERRGHPVLFPWPLAAEVARLPQDQGVNALLELHPARTVAFDQPGILVDMDTPQEYRRLRDRNNPHD